MAAKYSEKRDRRGRGLVEASTPAPGPRCAFSNPMAKMGGPGGVRMLLSLRYGHGFREMVLSLRRGHQILLFCAYFTEFAHSIVVLDRF